MTKRSESKLLDIEFYLEVAKQHAEDNPDHEVGDLQDFLRAIWEILPLNQRFAIARASNIHSVLEGAGAEYEVELAKLPPPRPVRSRKSGARPAV
jgi:hypothetical protein